ncbi:MAG TPA: response regulator transcription factor [Bacteroidota bacterium]|nr:response regulator transcription factor [Bacteroidota bacterium]
MKQRILLLEDDANLGFVLQEHLESQGFVVTLRTNGEEGLAETSEKRFDLCLVDVMMPRKDGFTFTREFRQKDKETPVVFLTAKALKEDRIQGFLIGGDDYVTKPFSMEELLLRIKAVLRRTAGEARKAGDLAEFKLGHSRFDSTWQTLTVKSNKRTLTAMESQLLQLLCERKNSIVTRSEILKDVWGDDSYFNGRSLDVFVSRLRKYLAPDPSVEIKNVHGKGYKLVVR